MAIIVLSLVCLLLMRPFGPATDNDQMTRTALTEFRREIVGARQEAEELLGTWQVNNSSANYCDWKGVSCDHSGLAISLPGLGLQGTIAPALSNLTSLLYLDLSYNAISGGIPPLPLGLRSLSLGSNNLTGPLPPQLGKLSSLQHLSLQGNRLEGLLPPQLGNLSSLQDLDLQGNRFKGPVPPQIGNLSSLQSLSLQGNRLEGSLPPQLECAQIPHHSMKGDIYSYGVVLLCMLTGRQPTSEIFYEQGVDMPNWVKCFWPDRYMDALHPTLRLEVESINMQEKEVLYHVMEVALCCTVQARKDRPTSKEVLRRLSPFKSAPRHL